MSAVTLPLPLAVTAAAEAMAARNPKLRIAVPQPNGQTLHVDAWRLFPSLVTALAERLERAAVGTDALANGLRRCGYEASAGAFGRLSASLRSPLVIEEGQ